MKHSEATIFVVDALHSFWRNSCRKFVPGGGGCLVCCMRGAAAVAVACAYHSLRKFRTVLFKLLRGLFTATPKNDDCDVFSSVYKYIA